VKVAGADAEQLVFERSVHTVKEAAKALNAKPSDFVKSVVLLSGDRVIVAIVPGDERVSPKRVGEALGLPTPRLATPSEVLRYTGFPAGGVPPFGYPARVLIDPGVLEKEFVYGGGGSARSLLKIRPTELARVTNGIVDNVCES